VGHKDVPVYTWLSFWLILADFYRVACMHSGLSHERKWFKWLK